jgi:predicted acetyltransferase
LGWFFEGHLASQVVVYPMRVNIHGKIYEMGGITGVATYPEYTGHGLIHKLMKNALAHMREEKQYISFLYPYSIPFYRKQGWEVVSDKMTFSIKDTQLPHRKPVDGMMRRVDAEDNEDIHKVYEYFALQHHGALLRDKLEWQEYWRWESDDDVMAAVYYDAKNKPLGFVVYYIENDVFRIKEMVYLNMEAKNGIWNYISAHFSMIDEVRGDNYSGEAISFQFEDSEISETIEPYIMARIVDVEKFMKKYPFRLTDSSMYFDFQIVDPVAVWNNGTFRVGMRDGKQYCEKTEEFDNVHLVKTDICSLTAMLMSYKRPNYLYTNERLHMNYNLLKHLEAAVPADRPYFSDYF